MAKALLGTHVSPRTVMLVDEVRALRGRVAQLEAELVEAEAARDALLLDLELTRESAVHA